ncbi:MAG: siderophore ABC transporter substrate-binding protein [Cellulosilyticum sp.]|nr:siderophore ABC transporter substrate-binding protein [Cellulosilyticum sp.]
MNKKLVFTVLVAGMMAVTGCGSTETATKEETTTQETTTESNEASAEETGTVVVEHSLGTTEVPKNPEKVVVLDFGALDVMDALELEEKIVGLPLSGSVPDYLSEYKDETVYTNLGSVKEVDLEAIHALEPDMIITGGRLNDYYEELNEIAPTVLLNVDNADYMNSFKKSMNYFGEIFGKEAEVEAKLSEIETQVTAISEKAATKNANALIALANGDGFSVYGKGSRFGIIHNEFGIAPVDEAIEVSTHGQNASFEYVVEQNPDLLFVVDRTAATGGEGSAKEMFSNELMQGTDAYKNDRIVYLNPTVWYTAGGGFTSTQVMLDEVNAAIDKM